MLPNNRLADLAHYVIFKCDDPSKLGATKLNKILWFADAINYAKTGQTITGERYVKQQFGPTPRNIMTVRSELEAAGRIAISEGQAWAYRQTQFMALKEPNYNCFTGSEISLVDTVIESVRDEHTARSISDLTHDRVWEAAEIGEEIPMYAIFASYQGEITEEDMAWASNAAQTMGYMAVAPGPH